MNRFRTLATSACALTAMVGGAVLVTATPAQAATAVFVKASQWANGYEGRFTITNDTAATITSWRVEFDLPAGTSIGSSWNATQASTGSHHTFINLSWNGTLAPAASTTFGFLANGTGAPTACTVNGGPCSGGTGPSPTSPAPSSPAPSSPTPSSPTPSGPPPSGSGCGTAAFCDGFEDQTGSTPTGTWGLAFPDCQGTSTATIDSTTVHSGRRAVRINGNAGYCNHVFVQPTRNLSTLGPVRYGRFWVRHTTALPAQHVTFLAMRDTNDGGRDLRMGGQNGALQWNRASDDATLPEQSPSGVALSVPLAVNRWTCVEFGVDGNQGRLQTWVDGTAVAGLQADGTPTHDIDGQWTRSSWRPNLSDLRLGWESYGEGADTLWFDDVALGTTRIGC